MVTSLRVMTPFLLLLGLGGCATQKQSPAEQAAIEECRQQVDKAYMQQNPDALYKQDMYANSTRDAPNATYGLMGVSGAGLGAVYDRNQALENCLIQKGVPPQAPSVQPWLPVAP
ncbi:MAG: hypothetical protein ACP5M5_07520 [Acidibrevibacterium sp.]|uniref:hypothetical protein n=1 Tax=Acidibrevibacterium sp. TaxID=2606776 RepID=UPI003CFE54B5